MTTDVTSVVAVSVFVRVVVVGIPVTVVEMVAVMLAGVCVAVAVLHRLRRNLAQRVQIWLTVSTLG